MTADSPPEAQTTNPPPKKPQPGTEAAVKPEAQKHDDAAATNDKLRDEYLTMLANSSSIYRETQSSSCPVNSDSCVLTDVSIGDGQNQSPIDLDSFKAKIASANDFIGQVNGGKPGDKDAIQNWLFQGQDGTKADFKKGTLDVSTKAADGTDVSANITRDVANIKAGDATIQHFRNNGENIYESANYEAIDKGNIRIIKDKQSGYTVQYDVKSHEGKIFRQNGELAMQFSSMSDLQTEVTHRLSDSKYMTQLIGKQKLEAAARAYLKTLKPGDPNAPKERGFVDGQGDFIIVTRDGLMYQTDKANHSVYVEQNGQRVRVTNGVAYTDSTVNGVTTSTAIHDFKKLGGLSIHNGAVFIAGREAVSQSGQVNTKEGTKIETALGRLTTAGETGTVTVDSGNGQSTVNNPHVAALTLKDNGNATNTARETQGVFTSLNARTGLEGRTANGATFNFGENNNELQIREPNGQVTHLRDNGTVLAVDRSGHELARVDANGDITLGGHFKIGHDGKVTDGGAAVEEVEGSVRDTARVEFDSALGDIDLALGNLSGVDLNGLEDRLSADAANMSQLAAFATSLGPRYTWAANILIAKAQSAQGALDRVKAIAAQKQAATGSASGEGTTNGEDGSRQRTAVVPEGEGRRLENGTVIPAGLTAPALGATGTLEGQTTTTPLAVSTDEPGATVADQNLASTQTSDQPTLTPTTYSTDDVGGGTDQPTLTASTTTGDPPPEGTLLASALPSGAPGSGVLESGFFPRAVDDAGSVPGANTGSRLTTPNRVDESEGRVASSSSAPAVLASATPNIPEITPVSLTSGTTSGSELPGALIPSDEDVASAIGLVAPIFNAHQARTRQQQIGEPQFGLHPFDDDTQDVAFLTPDDAPRTRPPLRRVDSFDGQLSSTNNAPLRVERRERLSNPPGRVDVLQSGMLSFPPVET